MKSADPKMQERTLEILGKIGPDAVPALIELQGHKDEAIRMKAAGHLVKLGRMAAGKLVAALNHENKDVRARVAAIIKEIGAPAVQRLKDALDDPELKDAAEKLLKEMEQ